VKVLINPAGFQAEHLAALNRSFPGWGNEPRLRWCFGRSTGQPADLIAIELDGVAVAGTGISYRQMMTPSGRHMLVGILTAAWSFPVRAERGIYMRMMSEAMRLIAERGGALALGFMPQDKSSGHQLLRAGAMAAMTAYMTTPANWQASASAALPGTWRPCAITPALCAELFKRLERRAGDGLRFVYPDVDAFADQFLRRPHPVQVMIDANDDCIVVEQSPRTVSLLAALPADGGRPSAALLKAAASLAAQEKRPLLAYASNARAVAEAVVAGLVARPAFMTVSIASPEILSVALSREGVAADAQAVQTACLVALEALHVENGDRM
jgi:hypothetical protein